MRTRTCLSGALVIALLAISAAAPSSAQTAGEPVLFQLVNPGGNPFDLPNPPATSIGPLEDGVEYELQVSGVYSYRDRPLWLADAECSISGFDESGFPGPFDPVWDDQRYVGFFDPNDDTDYLDLAVDGEEVDWQPLSGTEHPLNSACSTTHTYTHVITGTGTSVSLHVLDVWHPDNRGVLAVTAEPIEP